MERTPPPTTRSNIGGYLRCPYCMREVPDPDEGSSCNGLYEVRCDCGAWLEVMRDCSVVLTLRQCSPTVPPRVFFGD
jgi:hypothetical protein